MKIFYNGAEKKVNKAGAVIKFPYAKKHWLAEITGPSAIYRLERQFQDYEEIDNEIVFDLDIKVNRGDCLGYYGLAKDLSVNYNLPLSVPEIKLNSKYFSISLAISSIAKVAFLYNTFE